MKVYNETCEPYFTRVCVGYGVRPVQLEWCTFRHVCVYRVQQVQPEPCTCRRECMCTCVHGVWHVRIEWCIFRAEVCVRMLAQCSACVIRVVYLLCVACAVYPLHASGVERAPRTCMCTVFGMGRLSDATIVREYACVGVHPVRERVQCSAWAAWAMHLLCVGAWT